MKISIKYWLKCPKGVICLVCYFLCSLISSATSIAVIRVINNVIESGDIMGYLGYIILLLLICSICDGLANWVRRYGRALTYTNLNNMLTEQLLSLDYEVFTKHSCSHIITISEQMNNIVSIMFTMTTTAVQLSRILMVLYAMYLLIPISIIPYIILYSITAVIIRKLFNIYGKHQLKFTEIQKSRNQDIDEIINGFNEVRAFNKQGYHMNSIYKKNSECLNIINYLSKLNFIIDAVANLVYDTGVIIALVFVYTWIKLGTITVANGISLVSYSMQIINGLIYILDMIDDITASIAKAPQFDELMSYSHTKDGDIELNEFKNDIRLDHVDFRYDDSNSVLNNINLVIHKGDKIGICGVSGGGKTTLLKLLSRFYKPSSGNITIDGINLDDIKIDSVRDKMGLVSQDAYIFNMSIRENIRYGKNATDVEVVEASKKAGLYDFIKSLPDGFDTVVGPRGLKLSGGQKQRISLARVFIKDPEIVLLDEATSALDNQSETIVQESLSQLKDKTIITIAHRLSTIQDSDKIVVIDNHTIAGIGKHNELLCSCEAYQKLMK